LLLVRLIKRKIDLEFDGDATVEFKLVLPTLEKTQLALSIPDNYPKEELTLLTPGSMPLFLLARRPVACTTTTTTTTRGRLTDPARLSSLQARS
jgi:hypothetical protein